MPTTFAGTVFDPRFCVGFVAILGPLLVSFLDFFGLAGDLGASSVFDRRPKRNPSFLHTRRLRNPPTGSVENGPKTDPKKYTIKLLFGGPFWVLGRLLGPYWGTLLLPRRILGQEGREGKPKSSPRQAQGQHKRGLTRLTKVQERPRNP